MIKIVGVGRIKEKAMLTLINEYIKRLSPYTKVEIVEVADEVIPQTNSEAQNEQAKIAEGKRILAKIKDNEYVILLDLWGKSLSSEAFAEKLNKLYTYETSQLTFVIGGSLGLSNEIIQRANFRFKLSDCTFTHQMCRVLILEQLYRAEMINHHMPYHK